MASPLPFLDWRRRHPWLTGALVATAGGLALIGGLRVWITTDSGRDFIVSRVDGMDIAGYGTLRVGGLRGDPLSKLSLSSIQIIDENGIWLDARNIDLAWSPFALLANTLDVSELTIDSVNVLRRPQREPRPASDGGGSLRVNLNSMVLEKLVLSEGVAGPESTSEISARFVQQSSGALDAALRLRPIEGRGDRVDLLIVMTASRRFDLTVIANAPAGGFFSHLLNLEPGSSATLEANGAGDLRNGVGEARFAIDRQDKVYLAGKMENGRLSASAKLDATALPLPESFSRFLGASAEASLAARLNEEEAHFELDALVAAGEIHIAGLGDIDKRALKGPARLRVDLANLGPFWENGAGVRLDGELTYSDDAPGYSGDLRLVAEEESILPFEAASGQVAAELSNGDLEFNSDLEILGPFPFGDPIASAIGSSPAVSLQGHFDLADSVLRFERAELSHGTGSLRLIGDVDVVARSLKLAGTINQSLRPLIPVLQGSAAGQLTLEGPFSSMDLSTNLTLRNLSGPDTLAPLLQGSGQAAASIRIAGSEIEASRIRLRLPGVTADVSGTLAGVSGLNLEVAAEQLVDLEFPGTKLSLGSVEATVRRPENRLFITSASQGGFLLNGENRISNLSVTTELEQSGSNVAGPIRLTGRYGTEPLDIAAMLDRRDGSTRIENIRGRTGALSLTGRTEISDAGAIDATASVSGGNFDFGRASFGQFSVAGTISQTSDGSLTIALDAFARDALISDDIRFDRIQTNVRTVADGYEYTARLEDATRNRETDLVVSGTAALNGVAPEGTVRLRGAVFGQSISTRRDATWRLGETPELDADVSLLGGNLQAKLGLERQVPQFTFDIENLDAAPILSAFRLPVSAARIDGSGSFQPYGTNPSGSFAIRTNSPVSGLDGAIDLDLNGTLAPTRLSVEGTAKYGPTLGGEISLALPVIAETGELVRLNPSGALTGRGNFGGNLEAIRQIALAYGHDVGGEVDADVRISGTPQSPKIDGRANIRSGVYEYGDMGFRIARFDMNAEFVEGNTTLNATGQGPDGGNIKATGRLDSKGSGKVDLELKRLLVYDRNRDKLRLTGNAALEETTDARLITGALSVDEARFSLDNLPSGGVQRLDVRWREDLGTEVEDPVLEKPIRFNFNVNSDRRIFIEGRGLDSEWGVNVNVTGTPSTPLLTGRATLVRGTLELASRPFVFDSGVVTFDGPLDTANVAISADRQVDGFSARVDLTGSPARPRIELSSSPDLPPDEILSRMLFGRSAMDLSPLEAAELASSIARLSGQGGGINPLSQLQAGLGLDRLRLGLSEAGTTELGVGQYLAPEVYLEVTTAGATGNSVEVEWLPRPQVSVTSEAKSTGESRVSVRWKRDY